MLTVKETEFAALDFESAGMRPGGTDYPIQIGIAICIGGCVSYGLKSYIACGAAVTWRARDVHGIKTADLADAPPLAELWPNVRELLAGRWIVAHGAATEKRFLAAYPFHGFGPWVDTLKLARALDPGLESHALGDVVRAYQLEEKLTSSIPDFRWHDAYCDAYASLVLLHHFIRHHQLENLPAETLLLADDSHFHRSKARRRLR